MFQTITSNKEKGNEFVAQILQQRAAFHVSHPDDVGPRQLLGDVTLEQVAREIAASNTTSKERKHAYRGLSCLTSVCVGDIGDVILLYEEILRKAAAETSRTSVPIPAGIQADCFLALSSRRLYDLDRREGRFKNHALAFAAATHELLVRSYNLSGKNRLRQYSSIYVRVSADDDANVRQQIDVLRDLIDAGVFVYSGGSPRTKTRDSNPIQQFKLSYRKIYGLAAFIGLADRDRFELSGANLQEWLERPTKDILLRSQITDESDAEYPAAELAESPAVRPLGLTQQAFVPQQVELFDTITVDVRVMNRDEGKDGCPTPIDVDIKLVSEAELKDIPLGNILTGLGFEDRTLESSRVLSKFADVDIVHLVGYGLEGHAKEITRLWRNAGKQIREIENDKAMVSPPRMDGISLIDISGLPKPLIFSPIRRELIEKGRVLVCHTAAAKHFPLQRDLELLLAAQDSEDPLVFLERLGRVLKGESGPYTEMRLLEETSVPSRLRAMIAFASSKHERLFSLLDKRDFDFIEVIAPKGDTSRAKVAQFASEFLCGSYHNATVSQIDTGDLEASLAYLDQRFLELYENRGANVEIGLTGSKIQAVAAAILSARRKVSQAWYVAPHHFDEKSFSSGVAGMRIFDIRVRRS